MSWLEFDHDGELIHEPTDQDLDDAYAEDEIRRVLKIEDGERIGHVILAVIERQIIR